eukprot:45701-Eustigmatos_ZCMA.PRE.1
MHSQASYSMAMIVCMVVMGATGAADTPVLYGVADIGIAGELQPGPWPLADMLAHGHRHHGQLPGHPVGMARAVVPYGHGHALRRPGAAGGAVHGLRARREALEGPRVHAIGSAVM